MRLVTFLHGDEERFGFLDGDYSKLDAAGALPRHHVRISS